MKVASGVHLALVAVFCLCWTSYARGEDPSAREIMRKNYFSGKVSSWSADSVMTLINSRGGERVRKMTGINLLSENGVDNQRLIRFVSPPDVRGTSLLIKEDRDGDDSMWIYLPALRKVRRLVASNKKDSFVGSDFYYGDIVTSRVDDYDHRLVGTEKVEGKKTYVIESVPASKKVSADSGYSRKVSWILADSFVEAKVDYYDLAGRLLKRQLVFDVRKYEPGRWIAGKRVMENVQSDHSTVLVFRNIKVGDGISQSRFNPRVLAR